MVMHRRREGRWIESDFFECSNPGLCPSYKRPTQLKMSALYQNHRFRLFARKCARCKSQWHISPRLTWTCQIETMPVIVDPISPLFNFQAWLRTRKSYLTVHGRWQARLAYASTRANARLTYISAAPSPSIVPDSPGQK